MVVEMAARPVVDADLGDIAKFLTLSFGGSESHYRQLFSYWWESNACWHGGLPKGWAIKSQDGDIIAFTANIPFAYVINGQAGKCFVTGYTCVDENWRGHKLSKKIGGAFLAQDDADLLIGTDSTPPAYQLWLGLGMRPLKRNWREKSCRVLGGADHLLDARRPYSRALEPALGGLGGAVIALAKMSSPALSRALTARKILSFDVPGSERIETFRAEQSPTTYAVRDRETLDWMYFGCDYVRENRAVFAAFDGGSIVGYLAVKRIMNSFYLLGMPVRKRGPRNRARLDLGRARSCRGAGNILPQRVEIRADDRRCDSNDVLHDLQKHSHDDILLSLQPRPH